jgi:hypothetical protein
MSATPRSTRRLALLAVGLSALLVTAGCSGAIGGLGADGDGDGGPHVDSVPASAEYVAYVDAAGVASDDSLTAIANAALDARSEEDEDDDAPEDVEAMFEQAENDSGLDPTRVADVTSFGTTAETPMADGDDRGSSAMVLSTSYTEDELVTAMEERDAELSEESYGDSTLYAYEGDEDYEGVLAALGDGTFALGDRSAVEQVLDVRAGDAAALDGDLKSTFEETDDDAYVRFAMATPSDETSAEVAESAPMEASALENVTHVSGSFATGDGNVTTTIRLTAASADDAQQAYDLVDGAVSLYSSTSDGEVRDALEAVSVEQNGDTVTVTHSDTVENVEALVETVYGFGAGAGAASDWDGDSDSASVAAVEA